MPSLIHMHVRNKFVRAMCSLARMYVCKTSYLQSNQKKISIFVMCSNDHSVLCVSFAHLNAISVDRGISFIRIRILRQA